MVTRTAEEMDWPLPPYGHYWTVKPVIALDRLVYGKGHVHVKLIRRRPLFRKCVVHGYGKVDEIAGTMRRLLRRAVLETYGTHAAGSFVRGDGR